MHNINIQDKVIDLFFSREYDYALRIIRTLAENGQLSVGRICENEHIPQPFAYKILKKLETAQLVEGRRGSQGGYIIKASLDSITFYDVYTVINGDIYIGECMQLGYICPNNSEGKKCMLYNELRRLQNEFIRSMREQSLSQVLDLY